MDALRIFRVSDLGAYLRELLESNDALSDCWVAGEISNASQTSGGHFFFTLKDRNAQIRSVLFRQKAIWQTVLPQNGKAVVAHGYISLYEASGNLQFYVDMLQDEGPGALYLAFEQLKVQLEAEGLFADERKRGLPAFPHRIGIVTSPQGAALHDMLNVLSRRFPLVEVVLAPVQVQGEGAAQQIARAISALSALDAGDAVDLTIVARGGGSIEELWAFNEEVVARAIYASRVPVVTGVGHETDFTIADYVADLRAPTPSAAAELSTPNVAELLADIDAARRLLAGDMRGRIAVAWDALASEQAQLARLSPRARLEYDREQLQVLVSSIDSNLRHRIDLELAKVGGARERLEALSPLNVLRRGYAIVRDLDQEHVVSSIRDTAEGHLLEIRVADGAFGARVESRAHEALDAS